MRKKTPTLIQMETTECGATALAIILAYHGKFVPIEELRSECGVTRDGSNALNLLRAAKKYGLTGKGIKLGAQEARQASFPFIAFWGFNHFVIIEGFSKKKVYINDPAVGPRKLSFDEFSKHFTGIALTFTPSSTFKKSAPPKRLKAFVKENLRPIRFALLFLFLCELALLFPSLALPAIHQLFFDKIIGGGFYNWGWPIAIFIFFLGVVSYTIKRLQSRSLNRLQIRLSALFSTKFLMHILHLPIEFYAQRFSGEIAFRMKLNETTAKTLTGSLASALIDLALIFFFGAAMFFYDSLIASIAVLIAVLNLSVLWAFNRSRNDAYAALKQEQGKSVGFSIGAIQNIETIKAIGNELDFFSRWTGFNTKRLNAEREINAKDIWLTSFPPFFQGIATTALLGLGVYAIIEGRLTIGMLMALQAFMMAFLLPVNRLVNLGSTFQNLKIDVERLNDVMKSKIDPIYHQGTKKIEQGKLKGRLELKNVTFGYSLLDPPLIENFSLSLFPGQKVALVGKTGCGKSTLANLILGLYQPWSGEILYDELPLSEIPRTVFTNSVSYVNQRIALFEGTIKDNLTLWDETIEESEMILAAKDACIHEEILLRHRGYEARVVEGGSNFSGGERQRFEITTALISNPRILVLDEATSALDGLTEAKIFQNVRKRGATTISISHRISSTYDCDEIIVLERGKIVQRGSYHELKFQEGLFKELLALEKGGL